MVVVWIRSQGLIAQRGVQLALFDGAIEAARDGLDAAFAELIAHFADPRAITRPGGDLGDSAAHQATAQDGYCLYLRHCSSVETDPGWTREYAGRGQWFQPTGRRAAVPSALNAGAMRTWRCRSGGATERAGLEALAALEPVEQAFDLEAGGVEPAAEVFSDRGDDGGESAGEAAEPGERAGGRRGGLAEDVDQAEAHAHAGDRADREAHGTRCHEPLGHGLAAPVAEVHVECGRGCGPPQGGGPRARPGGSAPGTSCAPAG